MLLDTAAYLELIDWTAWLVRVDKRGVIDAAVPPTLARLGLPQRAWQCQVLGIESRYWRAIGCAESILEKAASVVVPFLSILIFSLTKV